MVLSAYRLLKNTKIDAITLYPFIFVRNKALKNHRVLINHEKIHVRQQLELLIFFFYVAYVTEYAVRLIQTKDRATAYRMISFEQEAYAHEQNFEYLRKRKFWAFLKYW